MSTILIADDHAALRAELRAIFQQNAGWKVIEAQNGKEAIETTMQLKPDVVVLDFSMPGMNGLEAAALIKCWNPRLPLILFTAHQNKVLEQQAFAKGFSVVVSKSEAVTKLVEAVRLLFKYADPIPAAKGAGAGAS